MKKASELDYTVHHLCIYDAEPRDHMWAWLRWHHAVTGYYTGETYHITDEGHADYTFLGCGGRAFQVQLEAPPYQFEYEQDWYAKHGTGCNHVCWVVDDARASYDQLRAAGAEVVQEFQPFPTYDGFVMADPEGRWIEIMEYTHPVFRVQELMNQPAGECGLAMIGCIEVVDDLEAIAQWYQDALDMKPVFSARDSTEGVIYLTDRHYDSDHRNSVMVLTTPRDEAQRQQMSDSGPHIGGLLYQALDLQKAYDDAVWAGMIAVEEPAMDSLTGTVTARLKEPSGNQIILREVFKPS